jgi:hypothetical protein
VSKFIDGSKDPELSPVAEAHIMHGVKPNDAAHIWGQRGGTPAWDGQELDGAFTQGDSNKGVNYAPKSDAGHTIKAGPFQGSADGMPGSAKRLWNK